MARNGDKLGNFLQYLIIICFLVREMLIVIKMNLLLTPLFYAGIVLTFLFIVYSFFRLKKATLCLILSVILAAILLYYALFICKNYENETNEAIGRFITILLIGLLSTSSIHSNVGHLKLIVISNVFLSFLMFLASFLDASYSKGELVFGYSNPNTVGISSMICCFSLILGLVCFKTKFNRIVIFSAFLASLYICWISQSRSSLLCILLVFAFVILFKNRKMNRVSNKKTSGVFFLVAASVLLAFLFPTIWILLYRNASNRNVEIFGKIVFSNRENIWDYIYNVVTKNPMDSHFGVEFPFTSTHNVGLSLWWSYGIIPTLLFFGIYFLFTVSLFKKNGSDCRKTVFFIILFSLITMTFETTLFSGGVNFTFRLFYLATFAKFNYVDAKEKKTEIIYDKCYCTGI